MHGRYHLLAGSLGYVRVAWEECVRAAKVYVWEAFMGEMYWRHVCKTRMGGVHVNCNVWGGYTAVWKVCTMWGTIALLAVEVLSAIGLCVVRGDLPVQSQG